MLAGPFVVDTAHVLAVVQKCRVVPWRPELVAWIAVPMEAEAPHEALRCFIGVDCVCSLEHFITVVIPCDELQIQAAFLQRGAQMIADKVTLLFGTISAAFPMSVIVGLVLHREAPQRQAHAQKLLRKSHEVLRPSRSAILAQAAARTHPLLFFHPSGGAPRAGQQVQLVATSGLERLPHHRDDRALVPLDAETRQLHVPGCVAAAPIALGEVAGVHVDAPEAVAEPRILGEIRICQPRLFRITHRKLGGSFGESAAEAEERLVFDARVNRHRHLPWARADPLRAGSCEAQGLQHTKELASFGRLHYHHLVLPWSRRRLHWKLHLLRSQQAIHASCHLLAPSVAD
mmetsp:Transcript_46015/g.127795  ORF Transcript_46015/g.127795 Transcript_46015/m.127795 type:complete len:345 (-) Transcript_46015:88-1122(-)